MPDASRDEIYFALAREALLEITRDDTLGEPLEVVDEADGTATVRFANTLPGYPGWKWTVSVAEVDGEDPTVLETELVPGDGSLLAPDWVPWAERLAEYEASQEALHAAEGEHDGDDESDDDESDDDDDDESDDDDDESDDDDDDDESDDDDDDDESDDDDDIDDESDDDDDIDDDEDDDDFDDDEEYDGVDVEEAEAALDGDADDEE
ncbi:DUF3027 domain-containing protein [Frondihabitans australicus]|uniref:DUF3027 family protein n=1 Tax=Frondihabitans australicus TaxID=386892 RepID=A0A495IHX6_9MICO|nr:DUF3027 domain-containing protein [Frondihabitans australicus]RKR75310.1 hypothetical protein C8E83_2450 [Frondihabitans australicus]